jgi:hypothetical protein
MNADKPKAGKRRTVIRRAMRLLGIALTFAAVAPGCYNPFLPPLGPPHGGAEITPARMIDQLMSAYENRRIDLFEDLFLTAEFRFYVSPNFNDQYQGKVYSNPMEDIDSQYHEIYYESTVRSYYYWVFSYERQSHEHLFERATSIYFDQRLQVETVLYSILPSGDTTMAEVVTNGGRLSIYSRASSAAPLEYYEVDIQKQVFYLKRDDAGSWRIFKWFDLGTALN